MDIELNPVIPTLPKAVDKTKLDVRYGLIPPFSYAHIYWDDTKKEVVYEVEEPLLSEKEKAMFKKLEEGFRETINLDVLQEKTIAGILDYLERTLKKLIIELNLKIEPDTYEKIVYYLFRDFIGLNEIEPIIRDYYIEDIDAMA